MKRAIRITVLMLGLVGTFVAATVQQLPAADGGPIFLCPPKAKNCRANVTQVVNLSQPGAAR